ncbi:MAG: hypothetical protein CM15mP51_25480 [Porticoccaceae bacterium]|nr:MAG: hypothetical protein CM15mP51_25480 [Porticoccaceae bacterium]
MINEWYPQLMIDGHEMGAQDTFNGSTPTTFKQKYRYRLAKMGAHICKRASEAFDVKNWRYYTGEWFEIFIQVIQIIQNIGAVCIFFTNNPGWLKTV